MSLNIWFCVNIYVVLLVNVASYGELLRRNLVQFQKSFITHIANISQVTIMRVTNVNVKDRVFLFSHLY